VREGGGAGLEVVEAVQYAVPAMYAPAAPSGCHASPSDAAAGSPLEDASVTYQVRLANGQRLRVVVYVVYDAAQPVRAKPGGGAPAPASAAAAAAPSSSAAGGDKTFYQWQAVARAACRKCCVGPVLRSIQRFGRLGRRSGVPGEAGVTTLPAPAPSPSPGGPGWAPAEMQQVKEAKYLYLSIDEAGTHVGARAFRLVLGAYDAGGSALLGSSVSPPIRVLANNDVPTGAAFIGLTLPLRSDWAGWSAASTPAPTGLESAPRRARAGAAAAAGGVTPPGRVALAARAAAAAAAATAAVAGVRPAVLTGVPGHPGAARPAARRPSGAAGGGGGGRP